MVSLFQLHVLLLVSCLSVSVSVACNLSIANKFRSLVFHVRRALKLEPPEHNRQCRRATEKLRKRRRFGITFGLQQAQCRCPKRASSQGPARNKGIHDALPDETKHRSSWLDKVFGDEIGGWIHAARGANDTWIDIDDLLFAVALLALTYSCSTHLRTARQSPHAFIIAVCTFVQSLALIEQHIGFSKTCTPSQTRPKPTSSPLSPANKGNRVERSGAKTKGGSPPGKSKKQNKGEPAITNDVEEKDIDDNNAQLLDCPFHKFDPESYRSCGRMGLTTWPRLVQHLRRAHMLGPYFCPTCWTAFRTEELRDTHSRDQPCFAVLGPERFTSDEDERLRQGLQVLRGAGEREKWYWVWDTFFSGHPRPSSPYVGSVIEETAIFLSRGPASEAFRNGLHRLLQTTQAISDVNILELIREAGSHLGRPLRLFPGLQPDAPPPDPTPLVAPNDPPVLQQAPLDNGLHQPSPPLGPTAQQAAEALAPEIDAGLQDEELNSFDFLLALGQSEFAPDATGQENLDNEQQETLNWELDQAS